jgi:hypothetical protein
MLMLYSFGLYGWRALGIILGIYTSYRADTDFYAEVSFHMGWFSSIGIFLWYHQAYLLLPKIKTGYSKTAY